MDAAAVLTCVAGMPASGQPLLMHVPPTRRHLAIWPVTVSSHRRYELLETNAVMPFNTTGEAVMGLENRFTLSSAPTMSE